MQTTALRSPHPPVPVVGQSVAGLLAAGLIAVGMVPVLNASGISLALALAAGIGLVGMTLLAVARYDAAVGVGFLLMAVVRFEPAPPDAAFAVIMAVAAVTGRFHLSRAPRTIAWLIAALIALNLLSMMDALVTTEALRYAFITAYLAIFALWLTGYVDSPRRTKLIVVTWLVVGVVSAVVSSVALNIGFPGGELLLRRGDMRASGLFKDPNVFGPFLIPIAVILLEERIQPRLLRLRGWVSTLLLVALALGILFSYSRAAWGNFAIAVLVMLAAAAMRRSGGRRAMRTLASLVLIGAVVAVVLSASGSVGFLESRAQLQTYDSERFAAQSAGYELGWAYPVGVGPGQFQFHYTMEVHSTYLRVLSEQGFLGLAIWLALTLATLVFALSNVVRGRDTYGIGSAALLGSWCGLVFNAAVVDTLHWRHLWVVAALIWVGAIREREAAASARSALPAARPS